MEAERVKMTMTVDDDDRGQDKVPLSGESKLSF